MMVHINIQDFRPSQQWRRDARNHTQNLRASGDKAQYFEKHPIWTNLIDEWRAKYNKCWITESINPAAHPSIEHFRPKGKVSLNSQVKELTLRIARRQNNTGYWWLGYNWTNYRLSFPLPNTSKSIFFPLKYNSPIARREADNYSLEIYYLIDPTVSSDVELLTIEPADGKYKPTANNKNKSANEKWKYSRAVASIAIYDLDNPWLVDARITLIKECKQDLENCLNNFKNSLKFLEENPDAANEFLKNTQGLIEKLKSRMNKSSPFSLAAKISILAILETEEYTDLKQFFLN